MHGELSTLLAAVVRVSDGTVQVDVNRGAIEAAVRELSEGSLTLLLDSSLSLSFPAGRTAPTEELVGLLHDRWRAYLTERPNFSRQTLHRVLEALGAGYSKAQVAGMLGESVAAVEHRLGLIAQRGPRA